jgi:hypothetical protein
MIFYFASAWARRNELRAAMRELPRDFECNSRWLKGEHKADISQTEAFAPDGPAHGFALEDCEDIMRADAFVFFSSSVPGQRQPLSQGLGGRFTEFGFAIGYHLPIFIIGERETIFHAFVPNRRVFYDYRNFLLGLNLVRSEILDAKSGFHGITGDPEIAVQDLKDYLFSV